MMSLALPITITCLFPAHAGKAGFPQTDVTCATLDPKQPENRFPTTQFLALQAHQILSSQTGPDCATVALAVAPSPAIP